MSRGRQHIEALVLNKMCLDDVLLQNKIYIPLNICSP